MNLLLNRLYTNHLKRVQDSYQESILDLISGERSRVASLNDIDRRLESKLPIKVTLVNKTRSKERPYRILKGSLKDNYEDLLIGFTYRYYSFVGKESGGGKQESKEYSERTYKEQWWVILEDEE